MTRSIVLATSLLAMMGSGCALAPPFKSGTPTVSREGVQVAVTRQRCEQVQEPDEYGWDLVDTTVEVQVHNNTGQPLTVHRDAFRLLVPDGTRLGTQTWRAADPLTVGAGDTQTFQVRFMTRGGLECAREMVLDCGAGLTLGGSAVRVERISFVPARSRA